MDSRGGTYGQQARYFTGRAVLEGAELARAHEERGQRLAGCAEGEAAPQGARGLHRRLMGVQPPATAVAHTAATTEPAAKASIVARANRHLRDTAPWRRLVPSSLLQRCR